MQAGDGVRDCDELRFEIAHLVTHAARRVENERHVQELVRRERVRVSIEGRVVLLFRELEQSRYPGGFEARAVVEKTVEVAIVVPRAGRERSGLYGRGSRAGAAASSTAT